MRRIKWYPIVLKTKDGNKWGYMDKNGRYVIRPVFQEAQDFQENGLAIVKKGNLYGVINEKFDYVVPPKYETIYPFSEGRAQVIDDQGYRVIDEKGKELTKKAIVTSVNIQTHEQLLLIRWKTGAIFTVI